MARGETSEPLARPDPLSDEQWRAVYQMVVARYQYEVKAWSSYRLRKDEALFTGATPVPPTGDDGVNMEGIMIAIARHLGLMP